MRARNLHGKHHHGETRCSSAYNPFHELASAKAVSCIKCLKYVSSQNRLKVSSIGNRTLADFKQSQILYFVVQFCSLLHLFSEN